MPNSCFHRLIGNMVPDLRHSLSFYSAINIYERFPNTWLTIFRWNSPNYLFFRPQNVMKQSWKNKKCFISQNFIVVSAGLSLCHYSSISAVL